MFPRRVHRDRRSRPAAGATTCWGRWTADGQALLSARRGTGQDVRVQILRTPDERFTGLPDFPWEPGYVEVDSGDGSGPLRVGYVAAGPMDGPLVLSLHGEPTWSFLYRKVLSVLADAGLRGIAVDLVGFGRSDKPASVADYTYARHVE